MNDMTVDVMMDVEIVGGGRRVRGHKAFADAAANLTPVGDQKPACGDPGARFPLRIVAGCYLYPISAFGGHWRALCGAVVANRKEDPLVVERQIERTPRGDIMLVFPRLESHFGHEPR